MMTFTNLTGLAGIVMSIATAGALLFHAIRIPRRYLTVLAFAIGVMACIPLAGLPAAAYVRGVTGDLSITLAVLLMLKLLTLFTERSFFGKGEKVLLWVLIVLGALALYPFALEIGYVDPYRWGFGNMWLLAALFIIAASAFFQRFYVIVLCIALAVLAWSVGWNEANNLWNYLLDPFVAIYAVGALICGGLRQMGKTKRDACSKSTFTT